MVMRSWKKKEEVKWYGPNPPIFCVDYQPWQPVAVWFLGALTCHRIESSTSPHIRAPNVHTIAVIHNSHDILGTGYVSTVHQANRETHTHLHTSTRTFLDYHDCIRCVQVLIEEELGQNPESGEGWTEYNFQALGCWGLYCEHGSVSCKWYCSRQSWWTYLKPGDYLVLE